MALFRPRLTWRTRLLVLLAIALLAWIYSLQFHPAREDAPGQRAALANRVRATQPPRVDAPTLLADVKALADPRMEGRAVGTVGGRRARDYLRQRFAAIGLEPVGRGFDQPFSFTPGRGLRFWNAKFWQAPRPVAGVNLVGRIRGSALPGSVLVVSAHYDHLGIRKGLMYPGADDNASGVAAMLAAATWFKAHPPRHTLLFVAFDGEERGLRGARAFVASPPVPLQSIRMNLNFDMLSRNPAGEIFVTGLHANPQLRPLVDRVRISATPTILYGHDFPRPFWNTDDWTGQSDQGAFADRGIPFLYVGVEDHPDYHRPTDSFARIDAPFYSGVANAMVDLVLSLDTADDAQIAKRM